MDKKLKIAILYDSWGEEEAAPEPEKKKRTPGKRRKKREKMEGEEGERVPRKTRKRSASGETKAKMRSRGKSGEPTLV